MKAYIKDGNVFFNSAHKGLLNLGCPYQGALWGLNECPQGWDSREVLTEAGFSQNFFASADAILKAINSFTSDWLAEKLYELWIGGNDIGYTCEERVEKTTQIDIRVDTASWAPQSREPIEIQYWTAIRVSCWLVNGNPFVTVNQEYGSSQGRPPVMPILARKPLSSFPSVQVDCVKEGLIQVK